MALNAVDLSSRGGLTHFRVPVLPAGEVGQKKGDGARADFFPPAPSGDSAARPDTPGIESESKTGHPGTALPQFNVISNPFP